MPGFAYDMVIAEKLRGFRDAYPDIEVEISINESFVNLFEERFHAGIRFGDRIDPDMIAVRISPPHPLAVLTSRDYLDIHGTPTTPQDLLDHDCIRYRFGGSGRFAPWEFVGPDGRYSVEVSGHLVVNTLPSLYSAIGKCWPRAASWIDRRGSSIRWRRCGKADRVQQR